MVVLLSFLLTLTFVPSMILDLSVVGPKSFAFNSHRIRSLFSIILFSPRSFQKAVLK